jgi:hypothetical protein
MNKTKNISEILTKYNEMKTNENIKREIDDIIDCILDPNKSIDKYKEYNDTKKPEISEIFHLFKMIIDNLK